MIDQEHVLRDPQVHGGYVQIRSEKSLPGSHSLLGLVSTS